MNRRDFVILSGTVGGGLALGFAPALQASDAHATELTPWIEIAPDDVITVRVTTPEVGNGVMTQVLMTVAEELQCDWSKVRGELASPNRDFLEANLYSKHFGGTSY